MKILTWNVNGIRARATQVQELVDREQPDVVCLQELKATRDQIPELLVSLGGYESYWHGYRAYSGVSLHVRSGLARQPFGCVHPDFDQESRIACTVVDTPRPGPITIASVYVPNGGKDLDAKLRFLDALDAWAATTARTGSALIICGDLNVAHTDMDVHPKEQKPRAVGQLPEERERFSRILSRGYVDVGRHCYPDDAEQFTWWAPWRNLRQRNIGWRIDYVLASAALAPRVLRYASLREFGTSDHGPVVVEFDA
jgi:exodeoxyribonuclease-3